MSKADCLFLVECGASAGLGHLRRMLVLAAALRDLGFQCRFGLSAADSLQLVAAQGFSASGWDYSNWETVRRCDAVVIDAYDYPRELLAAIAGRVVRVVIDDLADRPVAAELVVNHNLYGMYCDYSAYDAGCVLAGPDFGLVAPAFRRLADQLRPDPAHILVSFGGTDDGTKAVAMTRALRVAGVTAPIDVAVLRCDAAARAALEAHGATVHVARPLEELMGAASVYVGGAGFTVMEATTAGLVPVVCAISGNQRLNVVAADRIGIVALPAFEPAALADLTMSIIAAGTQRVRTTDGRGAQRVARCLGNLLGLQRSA